MTEDWSSGVASLNHRSNRPSTHQRSRGWCVASWWAGHTQQSNGAFSFLCMLVIQLFPLAFQKVSQENDTFYKVRATTFYTDFGVTHYGIM